MGWDGNSITIGPDPKHTNFYEAKIDTSTLSSISLRGLVLVKENGNLRITMPLYYHKINLEMILRDHEIIGIYDDGEKAIRKSFDALLDFFVKLEYLYNTIRIVKKTSLSTSTIIRKRQT